MTYMSHVPNGLLGKRKNGAVSGNVTILILSWVLAGWEGTGGLIPSVFNLSLSLGTSGFRADTPVPACWGASGSSREPGFLHSGSLSTSVECLP